MNCVETRVIGIDSIKSSLLSDIVMVSFMCQRG